MATVENNICGTCNNVVYGTATVALDRKFHPDCFKCVICTAQLTGEFYDIHGRPHCKRDYERMLLPTCGICSKPIEGTQVHDREGNYYHDMCFRCQKCNGSVVEGYFIVAGKRLCPHCNVDNNIDKAPERQELGHCSTCYKRFAHGDGMFRVW